MNLNIARIQREPAFRDAYELVNQTYSTHYYCLPPVHILITVPYHRKSVNIHIYIHERSERHALLILILHSYIVSSFQDIRVVGPPRTVPLTALWRAVRSSNEPDGIMQSTSTTGLATQQLMATIGNISDARWWLQGSSPCAQFYSAALYHQWSQRRPRHFQRAHQSVRLAKCWLLRGIVIPFSKWCRKVLS